MRVHYLILHFLAVKLILYVYTFIYATLLRQQRKNFNKKLGLTVLINPWCHIK